MGLFCCFTARLLSQTAEPRSTSEFKELKPFFPFELMRRDGAALSHRELSMGHRKVQMHTKWNLLHQTRARDIT